MTSTLVPDRASIIAALSQRAADILARHGYPEKPLTGNIGLGMFPIDHLPVLAALASSPAPDGVIKEMGEDGRDPSGQAAQQSPSPDGLGPSGEHPSRDGMVPLADLAAHYGRDWRLWWHGSGPERGDHIMELRQGGGGDAREVAYLGDQYHDTLTTLVHGHNEQIRRLREVIARQAAAKGLLQAEVAALRARDQRAEREDAQRPRPEAASPVANGEEPASIDPDTPSSQDSGVDDGCPRCGMARDLVLENVCGHPADDACIYPDFSAKPNSCGGCGATKESERCMGCMHDFGDEASAWVRRNQATPRPSQREG